LDATDVDDETLGNLILFK